MFEQEVEREVDRKIHVFGLRGKTYDACSELAGAPAECAGRRDKP